MDDLELRHWMRTLSCVVHAAAASALRGVCADDNADLEAGEHTEAVEVRALP